MERLEEIVGRDLLQKGWSIACAESCTGGLLTSRLTDVAGSSVYVKGAVVAYSNEIKVRLAGVSEGTLRAYGAVSEQTAAELSEGIRKTIGTDVGIGITGIAGPGGGTAEKPVGLVYISVSGKDGTVVQEHHFKGTRAEIKRQSAENALSLVSNYIRRSRS